MMEYVCFVDCNPLYIPTALPPVKNRVGTKEVRFVPVWIFQMPTKSPNFPKLASK